MAIQVRRGLKKDFDPEKMLPGEWATTTDPTKQNQEVYMCFNSGNVKRMATWDDFEEEITPKVNEAKTSADAARASATSAANSAVSANTYSSNANTHANRAKTEADRAKSEADRAKAIVGVDTMTGATSSTDGAGGLVPTPRAGQQDKVLKGNGVWDYYRYPFPKGGKIINESDTKWERRLFYTANDWMERVPVLIKWNDIRKNKSKDGQLIEVSLMGYSHNYSATDENYNTLCKGLARDYNDGKDCYFRGWIEVMRTDSNTVLNDLRNNQISIKFKEINNKEDFNIWRIPYSNGRTVLGVSITSIYYAIDGYCIQITLDNVPSE